MLTTDFTGTYDYEMEEAHYAAQYIVEEFTDGFIESSDELHRRINKERTHWKKYLPETFDEFDQHFIAYLRKHLPANESLEGIEYLKRAEKYAEEREDELPFKNIYAGFRQFNDIENSVWKTLAYLYSNAVADLLKSQ